MSTSQDGTPEQSVPAQSVGGAPFRWGLFFSSLATVGVIALLLGLAAGLLLGYRPIQDRAAETVASNPPRIEVNWPAAGAEARGNVRAVKSDAGPSPTWLPEQFKEEIIALAERQLGQQPRAFSRDPLMNVGVALELSGWFAGLPVVSRGPDNVVRVEGTWRVPAAVVRFAGRDRLVSWSGHPMPPVYEHGASGLVAILNVAGGPVMIADAVDYQSTWSGDEVPAALELLALVRAQPWGRQVVAIDAADYARGRQLTLVTNRDTRVLWGGRPSKPLIGETTTAAKLERIAEIQRRFGRIDAQRAAIDISGLHAVEINISAAAR